MVPYGSNLSIIRTRRSERYSISSLVNFHVRSVGLLVTSMCCAKTAEAIELRFQVVGRVSLRNGVLDGVQSLTGREKFLEGAVQCNE